MSGDLSAMKRDFKGVWIPKEVWLDSRLDAIDKVILMEIDSLDMGKDGCFASNQHLAEFCQCSERKVSGSISKLVQYGYVSIISFDGRNRHLRSSLAKSARQTRKICEADTQNLRDSNTKRKTTNKTNSISIVEEPRHDIPYDGIIDYLNVKAGTNYKASTKKTRELIHARFNEGFTADDFKKVIDTKVLDWKSDPKYNRFLRPETLFGTKFEGYLNQQPRELTTRDIAPTIDFSDFKEF